MSFDRINSIIERLSKFDGIGSIIDDLYDIRSDYDDLESENSRLERELEENDTRIYNLEKDISDSEDALADLETLMDMEHLSKDEFMKTIDNGELQRLFGETDVIKWIDLKHKVADIFWG